MILAEDDGLMVGFAALDTAKANIDAVYVAPERWRQGIGRQLLIRLEEIARAAQLSHITLQAAGPAILFYQRQGYTSAKAWDRIVPERKWRSKSTESPNVFQYTTTLRIDSPLCISPKPSLIRSSGRV